MPSNSQLCASVHLFERDNSDGESEVKRREEGASTCTTPLNSLCLPRVLLPLCVRVQIKIVIPYQPRLHPFISLLCLQHFPFILGPFLCVSFPLCLLASVRPDQTPLYEQHAVCVFFSHGFRNFDFYNTKVINNKKGSVNSLSFGMLRTRWSP